MTAGYLQACEDYGVDCKDIGISGVDLAWVLARVEEADVQECHGVVLAIYLPEHYPAATTVIEKGIEVVAGHFPVDIENVPGLLAWAAPNNEQYSVAAGLAMAEKTECGSPIAVTQSSLNDGENLVAETFRNTYLEACPDAEVLPVQLEGLTDPAEAILVASSIIQANPDLVGAFSTTGAGPTTWAKGVEDQGKEPGEIVIISMDYTRPNLDLVQSGEVYMLVGQPLFEEFYYDVVLLVSDLMGYPVPYENVLPAPMITLENVDKYFAINDLAESAGK